MDLPEADPKRFPDEMCSIQVLSEGSWKFLKNITKSPPAAAENFSGFGEFPWLLYGNKTCPFGQFYGWERPVFGGSW